MTGEGVQQHYALQEEWQRQFASRVRQWAISAGHVSTDASREAIDRVLSEALHERGVARGASPSSVKKWRTGRFAPPPADVLAVVETLLGTGTELSDLLASITRYAPGNGGGTEAGPDDDAGDDHRPRSLADESSGRDDDRSPAGHDPGSPGGSTAVDGVAHSKDAARRRRRRRVVAVAVVLTAIVLAVVALIVNDRSSGPDGAADDKTSEGTCEVAVGSLPDELSSRPSAAEWRKAFTTRYREAGGRAEVGCPIAPVERQDELLVQPLPGPVGDLSGALVVLADRPNLHFYFNAAFWASYQRDGPRDGSTVQTFGGPPEKMEVFPDLHVEVELASGVLLVAEQPEAPYFYIPARFVGWWREHKGELGLPMGNPQPGAGRQDAQHGYATVDRTVSADPELHLTETASAELPAEVAQGGVIITEADGTSWWIPDAGRRQWIIDPGTLNCLGGTGKTVGVGVSGAGVATLEYAGIARCDS